MPFNLPLIPLLLILIALISLSLYLKHRSKPEESHPPSGYLTNYALLQSRGSHTQFYLSETESWPQQIYFEPVTVMTHKQSQDIPLKYMKMLASYFEYAMREAIDQNMTVLEQPTSSCITVRTAIIDIQSANPVKNFFSRRFMLVPIDFGTAAIEGELIDSSSREQLAAIIDHQVGSVFSSPFHHAEWSDVMQAFDRWAKQLHKILAKKSAFHHNHKPSIKQTTAKLIPLKFK